MRLCQVSAKVDVVLARVTNALLESLPRAKSASYDCERSDKPSGCLEGTRTEILESISNWTEDIGTSSSNVYFLNGIAGVGKTTIAQTIAAKAKFQRKLGADFFFSRRGEAELRDPTKVFPTIAYRLAQFDPEFGQNITMALEEHPQAPYGSFEEQLNKLIVEPLSKLKPNRKRPVVLVLDAFDECEPKGAARILQLLVTAIPKLPFFLKIFITARPEAHILSASAPSSPSNPVHTTFLHAVETSIIRSDIRLYLRAALAALPRQLDVDLPFDWVTNHELDLLVEKSDNLFIFAVTTVRFLSDEGVSDPRLQLNILLDVLQSRRPIEGDMRPFRELDTLYMLLLTNTLSSTNNPSQVSKRLQLLLGTIVLLRDPLSQAALEIIAGFRRGESTIPLRQLQSVILAPTPPDFYPRIYHSSFPDFLQDPTRCIDPRFYINPSTYEAQTAVRCLHLLTTVLRNDMLGDIGSVVYNRDVPDLEGRILLAYPPEVRYSCRFWASHLMCAVPDTCVMDELREALEAFASTAILPWLEAMSWYGETLSALKRLHEIENWAVSAMFR